MAVLSMLTSGAVVGMARPAGAAGPEPTFVRSELPNSGTLSYELVDLNGDGNLDYAYGQMGGGLYVVLGNGDGTFQAPMTVDPILTGSGYSTAAGDVNGDGTPDLFYRSSGGTTPSAVYLGDGAGGFVRGSELTRDSPGQYGMELTDLDADGDLDLVLANRNDVDVYRGAGDGTFAFETTLLTSAEYPYDLISTDINRDGRPDLVVPGYSGDTTILLSDGEEGFGYLSPQMYGTGATLQVATGRLTADGDLDVFYSGNGEIGVLEFTRSTDPDTGIETQSFTPRILATSGSSGQGIAVGDFNVDGLLDLTTVGYDDADYITRSQVYYQQDDGTFTRTSGVYLPLGDAYTTYVGDVDNDGRLDVLTADFAIPGQLLLNTTDIPPAAITNQPQDATITEGETATFTVAYNDGRSLQWFQNDLDGTEADWVAVLGSTGDTLEVATTDTSLSGYRYRAEIVGYGATVTTSDGATLTVNAAAPVITVQPVSFAEVGDGSNPSGQHTATFSSTATASGALSGQWQVSASGGGAWTDISGATDSGTDEVSSTLSVVRDRSEYDDSYRIQWTANGITTTSTPGMVEVYYASISSQPSDASVNEGDSASFTIAADAWDLQWYVSTDGGESFTAIDGAVESIYTTGATTAAMNGNVYRVVADTAGQQDTSTSALLTVVSAPTITSQPSDASVADQGEVTFSVRGDGADTVSWELSVDGGDNFFGIEGGEDLTFTAQLNQNGQLYRARLSNEVGTTTSRTALLTVNANAPTVTRHPSDTSVDSGGTAFFEAEASSNPSGTMQWQVSTDDGTSFTDLDGQAGYRLAVYDARYADGGTLYRAVFTNTAGTTTTDAATLTVNPTTPELTREPESRTIFQGTEVTFSASADGDPAPTVQWQTSSDGGQSYLDVIGATDGDLTVAAELRDDGNLYRAVFTSPGGSTQSRAAELLVMEQVVIVGQPEDVQVEEGQTASFTATADGYPSPTIRWQVSTDDGVTYADVGGATATTYTFTTTLDQDGNLYRPTFTNREGDTIGRAATLTVTSAAVEGEAPSVPLGFTATQTGAGQVTATWTPPADQGSSPVTGYLVGYSQGEWGNGDEVGAEVRSHVFDDLEPGSYTFLVRAVNGEDVGEGATEEVEVLAAAVEEPVTPEPVVPEPASPGPTTPEPVTPEPRDVSPDPLQPATSTPVAADQSLPTTGGNLGRLALFAALLLSIGVTFTASTRRHARIQG